MVISGQQPAQIPTSFGHELRACLRCRLVKTEILDVRTALSLRWMKIMSAWSIAPPLILLALFQSSRSWAARWLRIGKFVPGCYTLSVSEALPEDLEHVCNEVRAHYSAPKRIWSSGCR